MKKRMTKETAEIQATRFLCNLFLCPRVAALIVDQWMYQYSPTPVLTGAPRPVYDTPGHWIGAMVERTLLSPTGLSMTGYYNMTQSINSVHGSPQYVISAWTPVDDDDMFSFPFALLDGHIKLVEEHASRLAIYLNPAAHWNSRVEGPAMHSHSYYGNFKHVDLMKELYFPALFAIEILHWYLFQMVLPGGKFEVIMDRRPDACLMVLEMIRPLKEYDRGQVPSDQHQLLDSCHMLMLDVANSRDLKACYDRVKELRQIVHEHAAGIYKEKAKLLNKRGHSSDLRLMLTLESE
jgi:hypothetical protein